MAVPSEMRFIANEAGGPEVLHIETGPVPQPKPGEVLIRVEVAGVNRPDVQQRLGNYPPPQDASPILGPRSGGRSRRGERRDGAPAWATGSARSPMAAATRNTAPCPPRNACPGPRATTRSAPPRCRRPTSPSGPTCSASAGCSPARALLIHGGTGGIGVTAIQLAHEFGSTVYATAGSPEKCDACLRLGANAAINYREADFAEAIKQFTAGKGVNVVLDMVGGPYTARNLRCLGLDGRLVIIAFLGGSKVESLDLTSIMVRRLTVTGSTMRPRTAAQKGAIADELRAESVAGAGRRSLQPGDPRRLPARRSGRGAPADGEQRAYRQDHAAGGVRQRR